MNRRRTPNIPAPTPTAYNLATSAVLSRATTGKRMLASRATQGIIPSIPKWQNQSAGTYQLDSRLLMRCRLPPNDEVRDAGPNAWAWKRRAHPAFSRPTGSAEPSYHNCLSGRLNLNEAVEYPVANVEIDGRALR